MTHEYSYNELMQMQEQAIRRVRDMQKRASLAANETGDIAVSQKEIHVDDPDVSASYQFEKEPPANSVLPSASSSKSVVDKSMAGLTSLFNKLNADSDTATLLPLLLLLGREGVDEKLLLALVYIMT